MVPENFSEQLRRAVMRRARVGVAVFVSLAWGVGARAAQTNDAIFFANGDRLRGELIVFDPQKGFQWRHPDVAKEAGIRAQNVFKLRLGERPTGERPSFPVLVRLVNKDEFEGGLVAVEDQRIVVKTWYAGELSVPRAAIESVIPQSPKPGVIYEGPTSLDGWTQGKPPLPDAEPGGWMYQQGSFVAMQSSSIARDFKLPDLVDIQFDVAWKGFFNLAIALYADSLFPINLANKDAAPDFGGFYSLQLNNNSVNILTVKKGAPISSLGAAFMPVGAARSSMHVAIRVNKPEQMIHLLIDGAVVKQWKDAASFAGTGTILRFVNQTASIVRMSNLTVAEWDGRMEVSTNKPPDPKSDFVLLLNTDAVTGRVKKFSDGRLTVESQLGALEIPLARIAQLKFAEPAQPAPTPQPAVAQAALVHRGHLSLAVERIEKQMLEGKSPLLGPLKISLGALRTIQFKPQPETADPF
jgi:hypothetical protein